jgi:hypothetical protein
VKNCNESVCDVSCPNTSVAGGFKVVFTSNNNLNVLLGGNYEILEGPLSHVP